jgi:AraC-like DNA-binding protein
VYHFTTPAREICNQVQTMPPMITAKALGAMPQFTLDLGGQRVLQRAFSNANLPYHFIDNRNGYIPEQAFGDFIHEVSRATGQQNIGLLWAPDLSIRDYGAWGAFILSAPDLGAAIARAQQVMPLHSTGENVTLRVQGKWATYGYRFSLPGHCAYPDIAFSAVAEFVNLLRHFAGPAQTPRRVLFDFPCPADGAKAEDVFGCPVRWNSRNLGVEFAASLLTRPKPRAQHQQTVTFQDVARQFADGPPRDFTGRVRQVLRLQIEESEISIERAAQSLDIGVRALQRRLGKENTSFRGLGKLVRMERSIELIRQGQHRVTEIASLLGYSSSNNFSRAFKAQIGVSPSGYMARMPPQ